MLGLCLKRTRPRALMQNLQRKWFDRAPWSTSYPSKRHYYKRGKSPMVTIGNMHKGYIFRVFCWASCCSVLQVLLMFIYVFAYLTSYTLRGQGGEYVHAVLCCCSCPLCACKGGWGGGEGAGANFNTVNSYFTLESNQSYMYNNSSEKVSIQMNLKIPCTSCFDWQPSTMRVSIACLIALLLMLLLAKVKVDVFSVWPFSL